MTEKELREFLERAGRTPGTTESILEDTSVSGTKKLLSSVFPLLTDEQAEDISAIRRADIVETVQTLEAGGAVWDEYTQSYLRRDDFPGT